MKKQLLKIIAVLLVILAASAVIGNFDNMLFSIVYCFLFVVLLLCCVEYIHRCIQ